MQKSTLSMVSLACGIITTVFGVVMFPLSVVAGKSAGGITFLGMIAIVMMLTGLLGTVCGATKLMSSDPSVLTGDNSDRKIAVKGLWLSVVPVVIWIFLMMLGAMMK
jgi:uncharacterized membrane-anchored protein